MEDDTSDFVIKTYRDCREDGYYTAMEELPAINPHPMWTKEHHFWTVGYTKGLADGKR